jgi:hypothetical protein
MSEYNFENDLAIDPHQLDEEWLEQPGKYMKYSELLADAERHMKKCHEKVKVIRSQLIRECKENNPKATAQIIEGYYREHKDHKTAKEEMIDAEYQVSMLTNAVYAFTHRRKSLENLVQLYTSNYFSAPREPRNLSDGKRYTRLDHERSETTKKQRQAGNKPRTRRTRQKK